MKKALRLLTCAMLAPLAAMADTEVIDGITWTYTVTNGEASVGGGEGSYLATWQTISGDITIPSTLGGYPVVSIGESAFFRCSGLTSLTIPDGVVSIGDQAFSGCSGLSSVKMPEGVKSISDSAFSGCDKLTEITIPNGVTNIGSGAFSGCEGLKSVTIPSSVIDIGEEAFFRCTGLMSFDVDAGNQNYMSANHLLLTKDGKTLVWGVNGDVTIPFGVTSISDGAFSDCGDLTSITMPYSVTCIGKTAFYRCNGLKSITIPSTVTNIGSSAFLNCNGLTNVTFEGDAPLTGDNVFRGTPSDMVVHVKGSSAGWMQWNGRPIKFDADEGTVDSTVNMNLTITNVMVYYIQTSELSPMAAPVAKDVGIVNVMTEVKGGNVSIPESWVTNYPAFKATFGSDFSKALVAETKKRDAGGKPMFVWQDFVAGTDPTDKNDVFKASVTMVAGRPVVSYTPELSETEKTKRKYTTWGKVKLQDEKWVELPSGSEGDYNFFRVTVEMR